MAISDGDWLRCNYVVAIEFADGVATFYSGEWLRQMLPQAEAVSEDARSDSE
jgi:hypothetical protein